MAVPTVVGFSGSSPATASGSGTINIPTGAQVGDLALLMIGVNTSVADPVVGDGSWELLVEETGNGTTMFSRLYAKKLTSVEMASGVSWTGNNGRWHAAMVAVRGGEVRTVAVGTDTSANTSATVPGYTANPTKDGTLAVAFVDNRSTNTTTFTWPTAWTTLSGSVVSGGASPFFRVSGASRTHPAAGATVASGVGSTVQNSTQNVFIVCLAEPAPFVGWGQPL